MKHKHGRSRREFLTASGVAIALPFFQSLFPRRALAAEDTPPRRMLFLSVPLGFATAKWGDGKYPGWFPALDGEKYTMPAVHAALEPFREQISFHKNLFHHRYREAPDRGDEVFLSSADTSSDPSRAYTNAISCDQVAAEAEGFGSDVRYHSLVLGIEPCYGTMTGSLSCDRQGKTIVPFTSPARVFDHLFGTDDVPAEARLLRLKQKKSVLDATLSQISALDQKLNAPDRQKLDEVVTAVRDVERTIQREERWLHTPKPTAPLSRPETVVGLRSVQHVRVMFELIHAAFVTDSTRIITYELPDSLEEVTKISKHDLTHDQQWAKDFLKLDQEYSNQVARLLKLLQDTTQNDGKSLLDHTLGVYGSGGWGLHGAMNLPVMLFGRAGGAFKQGAAHSYSDMTPLANCWLTLLHACGVAVSSFGDSTGIFSELLTSSQSTRP